MSVFDDEIYTISDDSDSEHEYIPKKSFFESVKNNKKLLLFIGLPLTVCIIVIGIFSRQQSSTSTIIVHKSKQSSTSSQASNTSPSSSSDNQQSSNTVASPKSTDNPIQNLVNQVGSFLHANHPVPTRKPNWVAYPAGTNIQAQNSQNTTNTTNQNVSQANGGIQQNGTQSNNTESGQQSGENTIPTPINNDIQLVFKDPDGTVEVYQPPPSPPSDITWGRYVNTTDRYSIDYPTNWQMVKTYYNGHEGISLYLPGEVIDQYAQFIGFGWATYYLLPEGVNITTAYTSPISVTGVNGTLYTQGALGYSYIASVFQYQNGYWGLGTNISDPTFAYVYDHMINSLVFNQ